MKVENGKCLNEGKSGTTLYEVVFMPKGTKKKMTVKVWAKDRLGASNFLIVNEIWGKQYSVKPVKQYSMRIETRYNERAGVVSF